MSVLKINNFGGIAPAMSVRELPAEGAQIAENVAAEVNELRPVLDHQTIPGVLSVSNPKTIYRLSRKADGTFNTDMTQGWRSYAAVTNLVKGQINGDTLERTYLTDGAGAYAPRQIDASGGDRQLGVPAPAKPVVALNAGSYFTEENRKGALAKLKADIIAAIKANLTRTKLGATYTNDATEGIMESGPATGNPLDLTRARVHRYTAMDGTITDAYGTTVEADVAWVRATNLGKWIQADGSPAWMGAVGTWHYALGYYAYGAGYVLNEAAAATAIDAVQYVDTNMATEIAALAGDLFELTGEASSVIDPLKAAVTDLEAVLNSRPQGSYTSAGATTAISNAVTAAANAIYDALARNGGTHSEGGAA